MNKRITLSAKEAAVLISVIDHIREHTEAYSDTDVALKYTLEKLYRLTSHDLRVQTDRQFLKDYRKPEVAG